MIFYCECLTVDWTSKCGNHTMDLCFDDFIKQIFLENRIVCFRFYEKYVAEERRSKVFKHLQ